MMSIFEIYVSKKRDVFDRRGAWEGDDAMKAIDNYKRNGERQEWEIRMAKRKGPGPVYRAVDENGHVQIQWFRVTTLK